MFWKMMTNTVQSNFCTCPTSLNTCKIAITISNITITNINININTNININIITNINTITNINININIVYKKANAIHNKIYHEDLQDSQERFM